MEAIKSFQKLRKGDKVLDQIQSLTESLMVVNSDDGNTNKSDMTELKTSKISIHPYW